jgi:hypothetical protein
MLFLRAAALFPVLTVSLKLRGFQATKNSLQRLLANKASREDSQAERSAVEITSRMVLAAARHSPIPCTCLERSLALWWLLARQGITAQLRIGVRKDRQKFGAHAWVECNGQPLGEPEAPHLHYAAFAEEMAGDPK